MTESMIEKVALAIRRHRFEKAGILHEYRADIPPSDELLDEVQVAIKAMREPTERMINVGLDVTDTPDDSFDGYVEDFWQAMIDAALQWPAGSVDRAGVPVAKD